MPASLSGHDGVVVASKCRELLVEYDITDVRSASREFGHNSTVLLAARNYDGPHKYMGTTPPMQHQPRKTEVLRTESYHPRANLTEFVFNNYLKKKNYIAVGRLD
ncbi:hypothetical protein BT96DRAFT_1092584 [Gymnopus androsaceus JB14]|uniref:Uncharacterized protein n=1 Tax=Gymnopus androsaceus JB14 TaxID=1447944 RepID=A0A6A4HUK2_9AGAR|nr:hypothetical protein BT96DRAFT_1092584 [Gymnopus androsaceus JB14]